MKILIDGRGIKKTGIGRYIENTLKEILKIDRINQYEILIRSEDIGGFHLKADNLHIVETKANFFGIKEQTELLSLLNERQPDLVHFTNFNFPVAYKGKFVITIHDLTLLRFRNLRNSLARKAYYLLTEQVMRNVVLKKGIKKSEVVIVPSNYVKQDLAKTLKVRRNKITVTYEASDTNFAKGRINLEKKHITKPYILYVGNSYPHKNLERMIIAFGKLVTDYLLDYQLVIAGKKDSFHERLEEAVQQADLQDRVIFTGFVTDQELSGLYNNASLYVFPSLSEGFGLPPLEAMAHGLPVVSSNATCMPEILGDAAIYFDPKNINEMARTMLEVLTDKKLAEGLIKKGRAQVKKYSWKKTAKQTLSIYEKALINKKG
jgi:glycosyltransferase involved in cell wall biosynthesis